MTGVFLLAFAPEFSAGQSGWPLWLAIVTIAAVAGWLHAAIGFGFGIVAVALLPWWVDVHQTHVIVSTGGVGVLIGMTWAYRDGIQRGPLTRSLIGACAGLPMGLLAFEWVSPAWLVRGTGAAILAMLAINFRNRKYSAKRASPPSEMTTSAYLTGGVAGFLAGAVSIAGPPVAAMALRQGWPQHRFKAFVNQFLLALSLFKVAGLWAVDRIDGDALIAASLMVPAAWLGIYFGALASQRIAKVQFERLVVFTLVVIAVTFLI